MRLGIGTYGFRPDHIIPLARHIEALWFDGFWLGEHIVEPRVFESVHPYDQGKVRGGNQDESTHCLARNVPGW
jgi:hypothetical protein